MERTSALRREQLRILLVSIPLLVATWFLVGEVGSYSERPLAVVALLLPVTITVFALARPLVRERRLLLGGGFLPFFVAYCLLFSIAAGTRILEGRRTTLTGFEDETPSNVLGLSRLGDWHYLFARRAPPAPDIVVVLLPSFSGMDFREARLVQMGLIARATVEQAKGIAFDYFLETPTEVDRIFCSRVEAAEAAGVPVVYGYRVRDASGEAVRVPLAPDIARCLAAERLGTSTGLREADGRVRIVPTSHLGDAGLPSFSYRIASILARGAPLPDVGLVQFVAPESGPLVERGVPRADDAALMRDRFVIVGSDREDDVHPTPYGSVPGVMIHAWAAHALRTDSFIRRVDARWLLPGIFLLCYLLTLIQARGGVRPLLVGGGLLMLAVLIAAALAMRVGRIWIDASYPLLAIGLLTAILAGGARLQGARHRAGEGATRAIPRGTGTTEPVAAGPFDVILSHNSRNKPDVVELAEALRERGLRVWLDEWELVPGRPWQEAIEQAIATVASAAVLVGRDGLGPWELPEVRVSLDQCVRRGMPVIPVLLPGAAAEPELPLLLRQFTWVDLRAGLSPAGLDRLQWGITGIRPRPAGGSHAA